MAGGWAKDVDGKDQSEVGVAEAVEGGGALLKPGVGLSQCEECDTAIPEARRNAVPGVRLCIRCQEQEDSRQKDTGGFNRRGGRLTMHEQQRSPRRTGDELPSGWARHKTQPVGAEKTVHRFYSKVQHFNDGADR